MAVEKMGCRGWAAGGKTRGRLIRQYLVVTIFNFCLDLWIFICELSRPTCVRRCEEYYLLYQDAISIGVPPRFPKYLYPIYYLHR